MNESILTVPIRSLFQETFAQLFIKLFSEKNLVTNVPTPVQQSETVFKPTVAAQQRPR